MNSALLAAMASVTTFAVTSIDDLLLLTLFFSQRIPVRRIVVGQYVGFGAIIAVALIAIRFAVTLPHNWIRLLGIVPILIGMKQLIRTGKGEHPHESWRGSTVPRIAFVIFSNGADNIGVYLPFFLLGRAYLSVILSVYAFLIAIWCLVAKWLGTHPAILRKLNRSGHWIMPAVLIALGIYVLRP
jgi:cadmium resistance protein CadD (predicted permease)